MQRIAIVTGGGTGIGTSLARAPAEDGRAFAMACRQIDIGNAATEMASGAASGVAQADGSLRPEQLIDLAEVGKAVCSHGKPTPRRERCHDDRDAGEDAVYRPRLRL